MKKGREAMATPNSLRENKRQKGKTQKDRKRIKKGKKKNI